MKDDQETSGDSLECPHCHKKDYDCCELSSDMDDTGTTQCGSCEKDFIWEVETTRTWRGRIITQPKSI